MYTLAYQGTGRQTWRLTAGESVLFWLANIVRYLQPASAAILVAIEVKI